MFKKHTENGTVYFTVPEIDSLGGVSASFTTRLGGVSKGMLDSLNLGTGRDEPFDTTLENYKRICTAVGADVSRCVLAKQTHTANIRIVTEEDAGKGLTRISDITDTDGLVTNVKNLPLVIFYADCVPVLLYDPKKSVVAAIHAGWRGTANEIAGKAAQIMKNHFGCNPSDIYAAIGPSICQNHFETSIEVSENFAMYSDCIVYKNDKAYINLWRVNEQILRKNGVEKINISELCTVCNTDLFYSHRGCGADTGRMALIAYLRC